jgi:hypothetical protein
MSEKFQPMSESCYCAAPDARIIISSVISQFFYRKPQRIVGLHAGHATRRLDRRPGRPTALFRRFVPFPSRPKASTAWPAKT